MGVNFYLKIVVRDVEDAPQAPTDLMSAQEQRDNGKEQKT